MFVCLTLKCKINQNIFLRIHCILVANILHLDYKDEFVNAFRMIIKNTKIKCVGSMSTTIKAGSVSYLLCFKRLRKTVYKLGI